MLRCSTLIFASAVCLVCTSGLFGQVQFGSGFPSSLPEASEGEGNVSENHLRKTPRLRRSSTNRSASTKEKKSSDREASVKSWRGKDTAGRADGTRDTQQRSSQIDPDVRKEIEDQVRRDLEKKFESKIQSMVKRQVRTQVRQAQQKMERAAGSTRVAARPASVYKSRKPPTVTGQVLPLIVSGDNQKQNFEKIEPIEQTQPVKTKPARYLLTDSISNSNYRTPLEPIKPEAEAVPKRHVPTSRYRKPPPASERRQKGAQSRPQFELGARQAVASSEENSRQQARPAETQKVQVANAEIYSAETPAQPEAKLLLRTSIFGPETLLKDQSDKYEISVTNITDKPATNIIVQLSVPGQITISKLDRSAYLDSENRTVSWKIPSIAAGAKEVIQYRAVSSNAGEYKQEVTLGMENTFQGRTPFTTIVQIGAPAIPSNVNEPGGNPKDYVEVAERLELEE